MMFGAEKKLLESEPSRTSGSVAVAAILDLQDVRLIPEHCSGSSWEKVSEQPVQQRSLSVPVAPLFLNEWGCLITGVATGATSLVYKRMEHACLVPENKSKPNG